MFRDEFKSLNVELKDESAVFSVLDPWFLALAIAHDGASSGIGLLLGFFNAARGRVIVFDRLEILLR